MSLIEHISERVTQLPKIKMSRVRREKGPKLKKSADSRFWNNEKDFLMKNNSDEEPKAVHKARKLYSLCKDTDTIDKHGIDLVRKVIKQIGLHLDSMTDFDLTYSMVKMHQVLAKGVFFNIGVTADPYNQEINRIAIHKPDTLPFNSLPAVFPRIKRSATEPLPTLTKREYTSYMLEAVCSDLNVSECALLRNVLVGTEDLVALVSDYTASLSAAATKSNSEISEISEVISLLQLQNLTDSIALSLHKETLNWTRVIEMAFENATFIPSVNEPSELKIVTETQYLDDILPFIFSKSPYEHEIGMLWTVIDSLAAYSGFQFRNLKENYTSDIDNIPRESWCANAVSQMLGMAVSYMYAKNPVYQAAKIEANEMVRQIRNSFKEIITSSPWMDENTRKKALHKLEVMKVYVAFPDTIATKEDLDEYFKGLTVTEDFLESVLLYVRHEITKNLNTLNLTNNFDTDRRFITPNIVNAFYDPERNTIIIPAAILGFPIYGLGISSMNYGAIGSIIGHEITHGFDRKGRRFNSVGNLEEWWDSETLTTFKNRAYCFEKVYENYTAEFEEMIIVADSQLTLSENIADNGGFKEALLAFRGYNSKNEQLALPGFENFTQEQLFTLGFAQVWCEQPTVLSAMIAPFQDHSPNPIRVNGVASNSAEFSNIWSCRQGSKLNENVEKCQLW